LTAPSRGSAVDARAGLRYKSGRLTAAAAPAQSHEQWLEAVPICNRAVRVQRCGQAVVLWVPFRPRWWLAGPLRWLLPLRKEKGVALDLVGSRVWDDCDGQRQVQEVAAAFAQRHQLGAREATLRVLLFLRQLSERKLLVLALPRAAAPLAGAQPLAAEPAP